MFRSSTRSITRSVTSIRADVGRLHVLFRRENPTTEKQDFELLPLRKNKGRFIGSVIGIRNLHPEQWWGEGEIKVYMDGDKDFPTICGTGSEDYVGLAWGIQQTPFLYNGCSLDQKDDVTGNVFVSMYRWHLPDPIAWQREARITIQQIAWKRRAGRNAGRLELRHVLVRATPQRAAARASRRRRSHGRHLAGQIAAGGRRRTRGCTSSGARSIDEHTSTRLVYAAAVPEALLGGSRHAVGQPVGCQRIVARRGQ